MSVHENAAEFSSNFSAFVSVNNVPISTPTAAEAHDFRDIENGSLHMRVNLRLPVHDYSTQAVGFVDD